MAFGINDNMQSISANESDAHQLPLKRVVIVVYPGVTLLDAAGPAQVFSSANNALKDEELSFYEVMLASPTGGMIMTDSAVELATVSLQQAAAEPIDTLIAAGGEGIFELAAEQRLVDWIKDQSDLCRRLASTCMGAFLMADAGLLAGQDVTTHWRHVEALQSRHPEINVKRDPLFVRNGRIWSSAGVTAGIDLALAMVEEDLGHDAAMYVAQSLVVYFKRPGGQSQFSNVLKAQQQDRGGTFSDLHAWIASNLQCDLSVNSLALQMSMSPRTFARLYKEHTGCTPAKSVEIIRVDTAKRQLERGSLSISRIADASGFRDEQQLRRAFQRHVGVSPGDYRNKFGCSTSP